ncbi:MAG: alpha/beta fold hydrolase [Alphaproteobacteria bacterium]|nr:alpha/beta fold hydrolase [Alphaproteobacteria bacterium]
MPHIATDDGVRLWVEETGQGTPIVFVHEFAGDHRSWEAQVRFFSRRHRCVTFAARGYPPSDVPADWERYSQARAVEDIRSVMDGAGIDRAHVVGLSMGGFATLHFGLTHPGRALSLTIAGCGLGAEKAFTETFRAEARATADRILRDGMAKVAETYAETAARVQFQAKDPRGWLEAKRQLAEHSAEGSANTMRGVQARRPSLYDLEDKLKAMTVPALIVCGDEDDHTLQPGIYLKRVLPASGLLVVPKTGHLINLEEPTLFNRAVADFIAQVEAGRWPRRDPRAVSSQVMGGR